MSAHGLLTPAQAAERLGLSVVELSDLIQAGEGPAYIEIRRIVRFLVHDLDEWASQRAGAINQLCGDCRAEAGEACHPGCSSHWT